MVSTGSFRRRLTLTMLLLLFATTAAFFLLNYQIEKQILIDQIRQRALLMGKTLQLNLSELILKSSQTDLASIPEDEKQQIRKFIEHFGEEERHLDIYSENEGLHDLFFIDAGNRVVIDFPAQKEGRILPLEERVDEATLARLAQNEIDTQIRQRGRDTILFLTFPLFQQERFLGFGRIEMSMNPAVVLLDRVKIWSFVVAGGLFFVGLFFATYFAKSVTKPIGELVQAAIRIGRGDLSLRMDESRKDEIGVLKIAFNRMAEGILKLEETQKRVERLEVISRLGAGVAHEIKNPLNSLGLIIDHMKDRFTPKDQADAGKFLELSENMRREVGRLNEIVESFLRFAKSPTPSRQPTHLNDLIEETAAFITAEANQQQIQIHRHFDTALPKISADYDLLRQVLLNLLINAIQAMPEGGELYISTWVRDGDEVVVSVRDTGCGIPPQNLPKLFDPYFTTKVSGFGLGLSIAERIIQEHGGRIEVQSAEGKGSTFTLFLPVQVGENHA
ncbi:MAG: HAMP domain-containing protein [Nitrospirae bacterium]|nr:HAMP domain-containing protein [Nitrospirota bacterium]